MKFHLLIITAAALLAACQNAAPQQETAEKAQTGEKKELSVTVSDEQMQTINLQTAHLEEREMGGTVRVNGILKLYPQDRADVGCLIGGVVRRILVTPGQQVRAGQTLVYIENTEILNLQREYADAVRNATLAQQELKRQQAMAQEGAAIGRNLQQATADAKNAEAQRQALKLQLQQLHIRAAAVEAGNFVRQVPVTSPINGSVGEITVNTGTYAEPQTVIMRVQNNRALYADLNVYEKDVDRVAVGQEVNILLTNHTTHDVKAKVVRITPSLDKTMKTMSVQAQLIDAEHCTNMVADMAISAEIIIGKHRALAIPEEAVRLRARNISLCIAMQKTHRSMSMTMRLKSRLHTKKQTSMTKRLRNMRDTRRSTRDTITTRRPSSAAMRWRRALRMRVTSKCGH